MFNDNLPRQYWTGVNYVRYWFGIGFMAVFIGLGFVGIIMGVVTGYYGAGLKVYGGQISAAIVAALIIAAIILRVVEARRRHAED